MKYIKTILMLVLSFFILACSTTSDVNEGFNSYTIGYAARDGYEIKILRAFIDGKRTVGGGVGCCWQSPGATISMFDNKLPAKIKILWQVEKTKIVYEVVIYIDKNSNQIVRDLPSYSLIHSGRIKKPSRYFIVGFDENGEVIIWLSNTMSSINRRGRVIHEIGRAMGEVVYDPELDY